MHNAIAGPPRSGKSYRLASKIVDEHKRWKQGKSKYRFIYTNLNGFNFDNFDGFVKPYNKLELEAEMKKELINNDRKENGLIDLSEFQGDYDKWSVEHAKVYENFHHCWIVIDEAYNTFTKDYEKHKGRFLAYHGHFDIDIDFILQGKRQVNREYLTHVEYFYITVSSTKRLSQNVFQYKVYNTADTIKDNYISTETLPFSQSVADMYKSGSNEKYKSVVWKKFLPIVLGALALYVYFGFFGSPALSEDPAPQSDTNTTQATPQDDRPSFRQPSALSSGSFHLRAQCFAHACLFDGYTLQLKEESMAKFINLYECKILIFEQIDFNYSQYFITCNPQAQGFLAEFKGVQNASVPDTRSSLR